MQGQGNIPEGAEKAACRRSGRDGAGGRGKNDR